MIITDFDLPGYDILEKIGSGGMASVYRANQHTFRRNVALKILRQDLSEDEQFSERFVQESLIVAKLNHSHIVQVYDVGEYKQWFYVAMEFLSKGNLSEAMETSYLSVQESIAIFSQILSALTYSHDKNIVHRDVKPDNIMFRDDGAAVLTDFGIAKDSDSAMDLTQTGTIMGTPKYMSPEQIRGVGVTPASDLYSLGIVLFQMLTGKVPYSGSTMVEVAYKHLNDPIPELSADLAKYQPLINGLLAKNSEDRIQNGAAAQDLLHDIRGLKKSDISEDSTIIVNRSQTNASHSKSTTSSKFSTTNANDDRQSLVTKYPIKLIIPSVAVLAMALSFLVTQTAEQTTDQPAKQITSDPTLIDTKTANTKTDTPESQQESTKAIIDKFIRQAEDYANQGQLFEPNNQNAWSEYLSVLKIDPNNTEITSRIQYMLTERIKAAQRSPTQEKINDIQQLIKDANVYLNKSVSTELTAQTTALSESLKPNSEILFLQLQIKGLLQSAELDIKEGRINNPTGNNAREKYQKILQLDPTNSIARDQLKRHSD